MKNKILTIIGILLGIAVVAVVILLAGKGTLFQGALYNLRPVYRECKIEGSNLTSNNTQDCENFFQKMSDSQNGGQTFLPDGEYTVFTKYADPQIPDNVIPIRIKNNKLECTYLESGYKPQISVADANIPLSDELITEPREIPVGSSGVIAKINFVKNGQTYPYDDNICEGALIGSIFDSNKKSLGESRLDRNGFINSRPLVNELMISNSPYYNANLKDFDPGNIYLSFNFAPEFLFKFTIPCSSKTPAVEIPTITTGKNVIVKTKGLNDNYLKSCQDKIYWSIQNTNDSNDLHQINLDTNDGQNYLLRLRDIPTLADLKRKPTFPLSFLLKMHLKDRADSTDVKTLGTGVINVTGFNPNDNSNPLLPGPSAAAPASSTSQPDNTTSSSTASTSSSAAVGTTTSTPSTTDTTITSTSAGSTSTNSSTVSTDTTASTATGTSTTTSTPRPKVRRSAEHPVVLSTQQ